MKLTKLAGVVLAVALLTGSGAALPAQVPEFVGSIHDLVADHLDGDLDGTLGERISEVTPDDGADADDSEADNADDSDDVEADGDETADSDANEDADDTATPAAQSPR